MKRVINLILSFSIVMCSSSCMKLIFDGNDPDVMEPVEMTPSEGIIFSHGVTPLVQNILVENKLMEIGGKNNLPVAFVVNDRSILEDALQRCLKEYPEELRPLFMPDGIAEIDFDNYSLVIGMYDEGASPKKFDCRVKKSLFGAKLYIRLTAYSNVNQVTGGGVLPFAVLYKKLPGGPMDSVCHISW